MIAEYETRLWWLLIVIFVMFTIYKNIPFLPIWRGAPLSFDHYERQLDYLRSQYDDYGDPNDSIPHYHDDGPDYDDEYDDY